MLTDLETLSATISDLRLDIQGVASHQDEEEDVTACHYAALQDAKHISDMHAQLLCELQRHLENLDNRGRHHTLCVRILPEAVKPSQLTKAVMQSLIRL